MDNQNSSNNGHNVNNRVRLFGTWISAPTYINVLPSSESPLPRAEENPTNNIRLFGVNVPNPAIPQEVVVNDSLSDEEEEHVIEEGNPSNEDMEDVYSESEEEHVIEEGYPSNEDMEDVYSESEDELWQFEEEVLRDEIIQRAGELLFRENNPEEVAAIEAMSRRLYFNQGLTATEIEQCITFRYGNEAQGNQEVCTICLEDINQEMASLQCHHVFHLRCFVQWLGRRNRCPNCNAKAFDLGLW